MQDLRKAPSKVLSRLGWLAPLLAVAGFAVALPQPDHTIHISNMRLLAEQSRPFDRSVKVGLAPSLLWRAYASIDTVTPSTVVSNTNVDTVTPSTVVSNTNVDTVTNGTVVSSTNVDTVTPSTVVSDTNVGTTTPSTVVSDEMSQDASWLMPKRAPLPQPKFDPSALQARL